jgi:hypothetical protein
MKSRIAIPARLYQNFQNTSHVAQQWVGVDLISMWWVSDLWIFNDGLHSFLCIVLYWDMFKDFIWVIFYLVSKIMQNKLWLVKLQKSAIRWETSANS